MTGWMGAVVQVVLAVIPKEVIFNYVLKRVLGIDKKTLYVMISAAAKAANKKIDGLAKKSEVVDKLGDMAEATINVIGKDGLNLAIEIIVHMLRRGRLSPKFILKAHRETENFVRKPSG